MDELLHDGSLHILFSRRIVSRRSRGAPRIRDYRLGGRMPESTATTVGTVQVCLDARYRYRPLRHWAPG